MSITTTMGTRFVTLAIILVAAMGILSGCGKADDRSASGPSNQPPSASTPEETLEAFIQALEADDVPKALDFFAEQVRPEFESWPPDSLRGEATNLRHFPPTRRSPPTPGERWASFRTKSIVNGKTVETHITLYMEHNTWKILSL